jgi:hypothetical protein
VSAHVATVETPLCLTDVERLAVEGGTQPEVGPGAVVAVERIQPGFPRDMEDRVGVCVPDAS